MSATHEFSTSPFGKPYTTSLSFNRQQAFTSLIFTYFIAFLPHDTKYCPSFWQDIWRKIKSKTKYVFVKEGSKGILCFGVRFIGVSTLLLPISKAKFLPPKLNYAKQKCHPDTNLLSDYQSMSVFSSHCPLQNDKLYICNSRHSLFASSSKVLPLKYVSYEYSWQGTYNINPL